MRLATMVGLALRELWMSYRMLAAVTVMLLGGGLVASLPAEVVGGRSAVGGAAAWFATAEAVAVAVVVMLVAGGLANERRRGTAAWLTVRAVPRARILVGWFVAWGLLLAVGMALSAALTWFTALGQAEAPPDPLPFVAASLAAWAAALAAVALALLLGSLLGRGAWLLAALLVAGLLAWTLLDPVGPLASSLSPVAGFGLLAAIDDASRPVALGVSAAGMALAVAAALLALAGAAFERAEL